MGSADKYRFMVVMGIDRRIEKPEPKTFRVPRPKRERPTEREDMCAELNGQRRVSMREHPFASSKVPLISTGGYQCGKILASSKVL
jgi:hypothetical protein